MKKVIFAIAIVTAFAACNNAETAAPAGDSLKVDSSKMAADTSKVAADTAKTAVADTAKKAADTTKK
ncbi:hypothetical protein ACQ33O_11340 [Ferruginibacter sp. SUN002]|uniref:hypothetical protein n=1 Tax=Ferruginibacter sp. SUN002 TaxID=2937789 RepID=UPI003D366968